MDKLHGVDMSGGRDGRSAAIGGAVPDVQALLAQDPVSGADVDAALSTTKPSNHGDMDKYSAWQKEYGSV